MIDLLPEDIDNAKISKYIYDIWQILTNVINETTLPIMQEKGLTQAFTSIKRETEPVITLHECVKQIKSIITITNNIKNEDKINANNTRYYEPIIVKLHVTQYLIKADQYWYPYDLTPAISGI